MNVAAWAVREPIPPVVLFLALVLVGSYAFQELNIKDMPDLDFPMVSVTAVMEGASPEQLETEVTRKIENAVGSLEGIESIASTVSEGSSVTMIQLMLERDQAEALDDVRAAIGNLRSQLPSEMEQPTVAHLKAMDRPILTYTVSSDAMDEEALSWFVDDVVNRELSAIQGLAAVRRIGGVQREVRVEIDPVKLVSLGLTAADVSRQLRRTQLELSGGRGEIGDARQSLRTIATVANVQELAAFDIAVPGGRHYRLEQIADIRDTIADRSQAALLNGRPVIAFQVQRSRDGNAVVVAKHVAQAVAALNATNNVEFELVINRAKRTEDEFNASMQMLLEGAFLAMLVVFLFLRDWRATLISAVALPLSIIPTFAFIYWMGFSLNVITMLALTLVIGLLVDDTIVEVENIVRHLRKGKSPFDAATDAAVEIGLAVVATTFTLVAVFLPTAFMSGVTGLFFRQFGWTAAIAVLASLAVARLITPMLCARFLRPYSAEPEAGVIMSTYLNFAGLAVRHRFMTCLCAGLFFVVSIGGLLLLPQEFVSAEDESLTSISMELPPGTQLATTQVIAEEVRRRIADISEIERVLTTIGGASTARGRSVSRVSVADVSKASLTLRLQPKNARDRSQAEIEQEVRLRLHSIPGARFSVGLGNSGDKLQLNLSSEDAELLSDTADKVMREMRTIPGFGNISSNASLSRPEVIIRPDFARAAALGVTATAIAETVQIATAGDYDRSLAKLNLPERQIDIRVQLVASARQNLDTIRQLRVAGSHGLVPLAAVADITVSSGPAQISRYDRSRYIQIDAELGGLILGDVTPLVNALPSLAGLPPGVRKLDVGDAKMMQDMFDSFFLAMLTGLLCVFMVLVLLFKDFMQPITILAALPLSVGGAVLALVIANETFSITPMIGLLMLMGITTKNSILLVDYAIVAMQDGMNKYDAVLDACRKRARPIVMTTLAMTAGMAPVALGLSSGSGMRTAMGVVVIGGLLASTVLSLVVVPAVFTFIVDAKRILASTLQRGGLSATVAIPD